MDLNKNSGQQTGPVRPNQGFNQSQAQQMVNQQINYQQEQSVNYNNGYAQAAHTQSNDYQQNGYTQNAYNQSVNQQVSYNNVLDKTGAFGMNLMIYVLIGCVLFMCNATTSLIILFAVAFMMEKDNELTKVLATLIILGLVFTVGYNIIYNLTTPISKMGYTIMEQASYGGFLYNMGDFLASGISTLRTVISWIFDMGLIAVGALEFNNVKKGKFKTPKFITNYFN